MIYARFLIACPGPALVVPASVLCRAEKAFVPRLQQSAKIELIINMKTAKALGLTIPLSLLGRTDEVIE